jgi:large subunit ribosomal protein L25
LLEHIDLVIVRRGEKVIVSVPVHTEGKYDQDGILEHTNNSIEVEADVTNIPAFLMLSMEGMMAGDSRYASDVIIPEGIKLISDPKMTVIHLSVRAAEEEVVVVAAAPTEGDAAAAPAAEGDAAAAPAAAAGSDDKKDKKK